MTKRMHLSLPDWIRDEIGNDKPERVRELITKGLMYEKQQEILLLRNIKRKDKDAVSVMQSRDYKGFAGFPEMAV